jgi:hypothetical protein
VAGAAVAPIEALRVDAAEVLDTRRQRRSSRLDDDVVVVVEQAEGVDRPFVPVDGRGQQTQEADAVDVVPDDLAAVNSSRRHVEGAVRQFGAANPRHDRTVGGARPLGRPRARFATLLRRIRHRGPAGTTGPRGSDPRAGPGAGVRGRFRG